MLADLQKLSKDLLIYSVLVSDFEKLDFKDDALAGVRANYFNANEFAQQDKSEINIFGKLYNISYVLKSGAPLSWKITRNKKPYQTVKKLSDGIYCVITYNDNEIIIKRQYFNEKHIWQRTEYFSVYHENKIVSVIYPKIISGVLGLKLEQYIDGVRKAATLFPSTAMPAQECEALVYSNAGMIWYDAKFKPSDFPEDDSIESEKILDGFHFKADRFTTDFKLNGKIDLFNADYLTDEPVREVDTQTLQTDETSNEEVPYSAYDKIEKILTEAHKTNKSLFGEILIHTNDELYDQSSEEGGKLTADNQPIGETTYVSETELSENAQTQIEADEINPTDSDSQPENAVDFAESEVVSKKDMSNDTENNSKEENENISEEISEYTQESDDEDSSFEKAKLPKCDMVIQKLTGRYLYYGELDDNNLRTGRGRTVNADGVTIYDGAYAEDKKDGFGVCYYKEGSINYVGNWKSGKRSGSGVGYRLSDGTMHIGKWNDNKPENIGARFDKDGNFLDVCTYVDGVREGKSVKFDSMGRVVVQHWHNGELVSEKVIEE